MGAGLAAGALLGDHIVMTDRLDHEASLALLNDQHSFPGSYEFRVVIHPTARSTVVSAVSAAAGGRAVTEVTERQSRTGRFTSIRLVVHLEVAQDVLDIYAVISGLDGVLMVL